MKHSRTLLASLLVASGFSQFTIPVHGADSPIDPKAEIAALSANHYDNAAARERAVVSAALADLEAVKRSPLPMSGWTAQFLFKAGLKEEALAIVRSYIGERIKEAKARIANVEKCQAMWDKHQVCSRTFAITD